METSPTNPIAEFTARELEILKSVEENGARPIAASLAASLYQLFLEGYSCLEISKQGKGLSEGDILYLRKKNNWDATRAQYAEDLKLQIQGKLAKAKLESVEFLTNQLAAIHKNSRDAVLKYLMTGNPEDYPQDIGKVSGYKQIVEVLQKITGEDKVSKVNIDQKTETTLNIGEGRELIEKILNPDNAAKILSHLVKEKT